MKIFSCMKRKQYWQVLKKKGVINRNVEQTKEHIQARYQKNLRITIKLL